MRIELIRVLADWLGTDVNTRIAAVPVDGGDSQPAPIAGYTDTTYPTPNNLAIFDVTRHPWVSDYTQDPPATPALYIGSHTPLLMKGEPTPDGQVRLPQVPLKVVVAYIADGSNNAAAIRDGEYTLRAVARSIRELDKNTNANTRLRNGVNIVLVEGAMEFWPVWGSVGNARLAGSLVLNYHVRDQNPSF